MRTLLVGDEPRDIVFAGPGSKPRLHHHGAPRPERPVRSAAHDARRRPRRRLGVRRAEPRHGASAARRSPSSPSSPTRRARWRSRPTAAASTRRASTPATRPTTVNECSSSTAGPAATGVPIMPPPHHQLRWACRSRRAGLIVQLQRHALGRTSSAATGTPSSRSACRTRTSSHRRRREPAAAGRRHRPASSRSVGTVLFNMAVNPVSGKVYVSNTEASQRDALRGPGIFAGHTVRGQHCRVAASRVLDERGGDAAPPEQAHRLRDVLRPAPNAGERAEPRDAARDGGEPATAGRSTSPRSARARSASSTPRSSRTTRSSRTRRPDRSQRRRPDRPRARRATDDGSTS